MVVIISESDEEDEIHNKSILKLKEIESRSLQKSVRKSESSLSSYPEKRKRNVVSLIDESDEEEMNNTYALESKDDRQYSVKKSKPSLFPERKRKFLSNIEESDEDDDLLLKNLKNVRQHASSSFPERKRSKTFEESAWPRRRANLGDQENESKWPRPKKKKNVFKKDSSQKPSLTSNNKLPK